MMFSLEQEDQEDQQQIKKMNQNQIQVKKKAMRLTNLLKTIDQAKAQVEAQLIGQAKLKNKPNNFRKKPEEELGSQEL